MMTVRFALIDKDGRLLNGPVWETAEAAERARQRMAARQSERDWGVIAMFRSEEATR